MGMPTVLTYGSDDLQTRHLRRIFTGEDLWCQLFSEPTHGSDVAGIASRAVRDGDEWVVNGQKVWTTLAHVSRYGMLLTRTNPDVAKHNGLSYFVLDLHAPGVEVRPLFQMTGEAEFNEVFLSDVRIPHSDMLGGEGDGWRVALTTLMNERVALGGGGGGRGEGPIRQLLKVWERRRDELEPADRAARADTVASLWIKAEVLRHTNQRAKALARQGAAGPGGSVGKLMSAELNQAIFEACVNLEGAEGMLHRPGYPMLRPEMAGASPAITHPVPPLPGQHDRGRHLRDHAEHPRRAHPRPPRRHPRRQGHPLEPDPPMKGGSHCRVDAGGVPGEWVEACVATPDQPTIVYLHGGRSAGGSLETVRPLARELAIVTGARVLSVECATAADAVTAYAWLCGEGLDVDTTTFAGAPADGDLPAVRLAVAGFGLPLPDGAPLQVFLLQGGLHDAGARGPSEPNSSTGSSTGSFGTVGYGASPNSIRS